MPALSLTLTPDHDAPSKARLAVIDLIEEACPAPFVTDACLLTSEIVTNSVRHVDHGREDTIRVEMELSSERLRLQVQDSGPGYTWEQAAVRSRAGGWGLVVVDQTSDRWGIYRGPTRTWFEIDR